MSEEKPAYSPWWRWPECRNTGRVAWFVIFRRLACYPLILTGLIVFVVGVALAYGLRDAQRAWRNSA